MRRFLATLAMVFVAYSSFAEQKTTTTTKLDENAATTIIAESSNTPAAAVAVQDSTKVQNSAKSRFMPTSRRIDREINKGVYAYKGEVMLGLTVSYGNLSSDDSDYYLILDQLKLNGSIMQINPFIGYFVANNHALGLRFGYTHIDGSLGNASINMGESIDLGDLSFGGVGLLSDSYSLGLFYRSYVPIDKKGRFGLFSELELSAQTGKQTLSFTKKATQNEDGTMSEATTSSSSSDTFRAKLGFHPGLAVYIFPNVCATVSVGLGSLQYNSVKQLDAAGNVTGTHWDSQLRARLNVTDIRIGVNVHLWNNKKP